MALVDLDFSSVGQIYVVTQFTVKTEMKAEGQFSACLHLIGQEQNPSRICPQSEFIHLRPQICFKPSVLGVPHY